MKDNKIDPQNIKRMTNSKVSDIKFPNIQVESKFIIWIKVVGRTPSVKRMVSLFEVNITGEVKNIKEN